MGQISTRKAFKMRYTQEEIAHTSHLIVCVVYGKLTLGEVRSLALPSVRERKAVTQMNVAVEKTKARLKGDVPWLKASYPWVKEIYRHLTGEDKAYYAKAIKEQLAYVPNQNLERWLDERDN